jgi:AcrR family transcriptional regulator
VEGIPLQNPKTQQEKKNAIMENCFDCYCENGLVHTGIKALAKACGMTSGNLYAYFENVDILIIQSTKHCMENVQREFMAHAPRRPEDIKKFLEESPYWAAEKFGKKFRLMYQIYTSPQYVEYGKEHFKDLNILFTKYSKHLASKLNMPWQFVHPMFYTFVHAIVYYALFEDEESMKSQMDMLWKLCL